MAHARGERRVTESAMTLQADNSQMREVCFSEAGGRGIAVARVDFTKCHGGRIVELADTAGHHLLTAKEYKEHTMLNLGTYYHLTQEPSGPVLYTAVERHNITNLYMGEVKLSHRGHTTAEPFLTINNRQRRNEPHAFGPSGVAIGEGHEVRDQVYVMHVPKGTDLVCLMTALAIAKQTYNCVNEPK